MKIRILITPKEVGFRSGEWVGLLSLKKSIIAGYLSQIYIAIIGVLILPLYIKYMGAEAYGLVGFFTMLQGLFGVLDFGLTPTIGRETALYCAGSMSALQYRRLYRALSMVFSLIALSGGCCLILMSEFVATHWLKVAVLPMSEVMLSLQVMAICVAMRWMCGLYRGVLVGSERLIWLSGFSAIIASFRFVLVLPVMWFFGFTPFVFFNYQLIVALAEILGLGMKARTLLPVDLASNDDIGWSFKPIRSVLRFALSISFASVVWALVTQIDKLVLSGILPLIEYGYFTLAVMAAAFIMTITGPISSAIMPRMAKLHAEGSNKELIGVYQGATQLVSIFAGSAAITMAFFAKDLLFAWTGDMQLAITAAPILSLYVVGNGILALAAFPYYLQYAKGDLQYHIIGNVVMVFILVPSIIFFSAHYGAVGAGYVWVSVNLLYFLLWVSYVHNKLEPDLHGSWVTDGVIKILVFPVLFTLFMYSLDVFFESRIFNALYIFGVACVNLLLGFFMRNRYKK